MKANLDHNKDMWVKAGKCSAKSSDIIRFQGRRRNFSGCG